ncbi:MAG: threonine/serine exporter family protein [Tissierellia bacterium]|nr:threonine/serine exporter family protein [Tissierellia bacterium]
MKIAMKTGEQLLVNGAEIYRVEDTVYRILESVINVTEIEVISTYSSIMISFYYDVHITCIKKIKDRTINLYKIKKVNDFSRRFVRGDISFDEAETILEDIEGIEPYSGKYRVAMAAFGSSMFTLGLKGTALDAIMTFIAVLISQFVLSRTRHTGRKYFMETLYGAVIVSFVAILADSLNIISNLDLVIIGSIMILFPGVAITNAVRDIMNGDMVSGLIGMIQATFVSIALAIGVGLIIKSYIFLGGLL